MPPPTTCPSCGSSEIETDDFNGHSQVVCTRCGQICEQGNFYNEDGSVPTEGADNYCPPSGPLTKIFGAKIKTHLKACNVDCNTQQLSASGIKWLNDTKKICSVQGLPTSMTEEVATLFEAAIKLPKLKHKKTVKKQALGGACLYIVCKQNSWPILLKNIACAFQCPPMQVCEMYKLLIAEFNLEVPAIQDIEVFVPSVLNRYGIKDQDIHKKSTEICVLAAETWVTCGRNFEPVILAASYLACRKKKQTVSSFARVIKGNLPQKTFKRVQELTEVILKLAKEIPWVLPKHLKQDNIQFLIDDILTNKKTLMAKFKPQDDDEGVDGTENCFMPPSHKRQKVDGATTPNKFLVDNSPLHDLATSETLCELDIPESEIHEYIRNPEEVVEHEKLMKELEESDYHTDSEVGESENDDEMDKNESEKDDGEIHQNAAENVRDENVENLVTSEKSVSGNDGNSQPFEADEETDTTTEQEVEVTDEDASKERNPPKRKAPLVPNNIELHSKRPVRRIPNRNGHVKISQHNITRLRRNREQRQANVS